MADVFISYKSQNRPWTEMLAGILRLYELTVWWDDALRGQKVEDEIQREINAASSVVVLLSEQAVTADWVRGEITRAGNKIVPVRIDRVGRLALPTPLLNRDLIELAGWDGDTAHPEFLKLVARCMELKTGVRPYGVGPVEIPKQATNRTPAQGASVVTTTTIESFTGTATFGPNSQVNIGRDDKG